jgi:hypothetical protein
MNKLFNFVIASCVAVSLVACAGPKITTEDVQMETSKKEMEEKRLVAKEKSDIEKYKAIGKLPPEQASLVLMGENITKLAEMVISKDKPQSMGFYDMKASVAGSQNRTLGDVTRGILTTTVAATGIIAGADVIKSISKNAGDGIKVTGDNNSINREKNSVTNAPVANGDGSASVAGGNDSGYKPDNSQETIHEAVEPEVPEEVEEGEFVPTEPPAEFDDEPIDIPEIPSEE